MSPIAFVEPSRTTVARRNSASSSYLMRDSSLSKLSKLETYGSRPTPAARSMSKPYTPTSPLVSSPTVALPSPVTAPKSTNLVQRFVQNVKDMESYKQGKPVVVDGHTLSIAAVSAVSRHSAIAILDESPSTKARLAKSRKVVSDKVDNGISVYGVSTGFGGSAHTRTDKPIILGNALLQLLHSGVSPSSTAKLDALPLLDPLASNTMPESWVRGAILIRMNSLIRGHSGVRWELIEKMGELLRENITPVVPLRGSISASGDLSPLSYIAGTLIGNPTIRVFDGPVVFGARQIVSSSKALEAHGVSPLPLASKEHLGILNGTAFSASVAALALNDAVHLALLSQVCTAMGCEALNGTRMSFNSFINSTARPHPGQIESGKYIWDLLEGSKFAVIHDNEVTIEEDRGVLRQDRYPLRTAAQFIGPQIEDLIQSLDTITIECNSTTDNPLVDGETGTIHNGGNFQAMAVTNAMEKTRLSLHHLGKLLFAQCAELMDPNMNRGLPPSLAATDPSLDYHCKGLDIGTAAYVAELGYLANPVSTHIQSAEMHNQAVNSMALVSARATINSLEVLTILTASYLYSLCQALDLRALQHEFLEGLTMVVSEEATSNFSTSLSPRDLNTLNARLCKTMKETFESTSTMDNADRMINVAGSTTALLFDFLSQQMCNDGENAQISALSNISKFRSKVAVRLTELMGQLREEYLTGGRGPAPASPYLNKTRPVYEFVRVTLGVKMHGAENLTRFANGMGVDDVTVGEKVSLINEAIRDGKMHALVANLF
ncbi:phenylalanine ammonium lyase [Coprinopsis marcescibilis]|uniref:Phenylalanine ammonium lyase n=1 Tax=Coprinopsis marcescibilis TaxID=230819 RepID=A0A5C3KKC9_COPMA|nr:phenylalanine ammonium lyase [Coprinopsis marcescibilis]